MTISGEGKYMDSVFTMDQAASLLHEAVRSGMWYANIAPNGDANDVCWSDEYRRMLGFETEEQFPNRRDVWEERVHPDDRERVFSAVDATVTDRTGKLRYSIEYRMLHADGEYRWYHSIGKLMHDSNGIPYRMVGTLIDVTDSRRNEELLLDQRNKALIIETLASDYSSIFIVNLETDTYRSIQISNFPGFENMKAGVYSHDLVSYTNIVAPEYRDMWEKLSSPGYVREYLEKEDRREYIYMIPGITHPWRRAVYRVIERKGTEPVQVLVTFMNIDSVRSESLELSARIAEQNEILESQHRQLELALSKAEAASRAKTSFLSNMSHDIRTPMNAIIGFTDLALECGDMNKTIEYLNKIAVSSHHLLSLINDILDMSLIESGKITLEEGNCNLFSIVNEVNTIVSGQAHAKRQKLSMECIDVTDADIVCDKLRLYQVIINLVSNAIKFTPRGGSISLTVYENSHTDGVASYEIRVRDNGIGMSPEFIEHIFEPFERERTSTVTKTQGTGLGMSITKKIVDMMGGKIDVKSERGKGTEFIVNLAIKIQTEAERNEPCLYRQENNLAGKRVLLVEDNELNSEIATEILKNMGLLVETARDGYIAVQKVRNSQPNYFSMVLMDIQMPVMNGYEATRKIRAIKNKELSKIPIVAMTANAFAEDRSNAIEAGMNDHIAKPIEMQRLTEILHKFIV